MAVGPHPQPYPVVAIRHRVLCPEIVDLSTTSHTKTQGFKDTQHTPERTTRHCQPHTHCVHRHPYLDSPRWTPQPCRIRHRRLAATDTRTRDTPKTDAHMDQTHAPPTCDHRSTMGFWHAAQRFEQRSNHHRPRPLSPALDTPLLPTRLLCTIGTRSTRFPQNTRRNAPHAHRTRRYRELTRKLIYRQ